MTEPKKNLVENIKGIKKGNTYGLSIPGFSSWNDSNLSGLLEAITQIEELEAFPDFVGEYVGSKELEILLRKNIIISDSETKNALSFVPEDFLVKALKKENILGLSNEGLALITLEQWSILPEEEKEEIAMQLAKANRLQYLSEESLEFVTKKLNLYHRYGVNVASSRLTESELKTQLTSLIETGKLGHLAKEAIGKITDEIMVSFGNDFVKQLPAETIDYLATVKGDGTVLANMKLCALDINSLLVEEFKKLKTETIAVLTSKQISDLDGGHLLVLKENPLLINSLGENFSIIKDVAGIDIDSLNEATLRYVTNEQLEQFGIEQFRLLCDTNKSQYLIPQIIRQIPDEYLLYLTKHGLTKDQAMFLNEEQFGLIRNSLKPEIISVINANIIAKNQEFLKNLTVEQAENLTEEQARAIQGNDMLSVIPDNVLFFITSKIKNRLSDLNENTLDRIARNRNEDIPMLDSDPKLTGFNIDIKFDRNDEFDIESIRSTIKTRIEKEDWVNLRDNCFYWIKNNEQKSTVYKILNEEMNSRPTTVYGLTDKIQLLLATIPLSPDNKQLTTNYQNLEKTVVSLINEPSYTVDEYLTKSDLYSSLANNSNLDLEFREMICQEQIKLMEEDFVNKFYSKSGRNSLYDSIREEISKSYLNYANLLIEKYSIDTDKFARGLTKDEEINLKPKEREYLDCVKKIYEYTPDLENKVRYWTATGTRLVAKAAATYFAAKAAVNSSSRAVSAVAGVGAAAVGVSAVSDAADVIEVVNTVNNRNEVHTNARNGKIGILNRIKRFFGRAKNKVMVFFNLKKNEFSIKNLSKPSEKRAKTYQKGTVNEQKQKLTADLENKIRDEEDRMSEHLKKNEEKSRQSQLVEDNIEIRTEAIKLIAQKKAIALKEKYPEFQEKEGITGIFSNLVNIGKSILNGVISGVLDTASLGYGGNAYKQLVDGKSDEEKAKIESRLMEFQKGVNEIDEWLVKELNDLRHEECIRLASMNEDDKQKLIEFEEIVNMRKEEIDQEMGIFKPEEHIKLDKNNLLPSLTEEKNLDVTKLDVITEDLETLINDDKISPEIKMHNIENTNKVLEENFGSGNLDLKDPEVAQNIFTTLMVMNQFIAAQLAVTCIAVVANEVEKKKQELEKEQAKINNIFNDMQVKLQEIGVNPLNIDDTRIPIHV